ncbi:hypothetical protein Z043_119084 [Scleropages formosus]|uniref:Uncharacterized protein n=1 Tax=Scleropages formosus TaxID=113540 RepID=A0A0P7UTE5_SCLFO|nr:hypothetical protein Z043_119084 [Scleropages formosus]
MYSDSVNGLVDKHPLELPEPVGPVIHLQEKLFVPVKEYPDCDVSPVVPPPPDSRNSKLKALGCALNEALWAGETRLGSALSELPWTRRAVPGCGLFLSLCPPFALPPRSCFHSSCLL